MLKKPVLALEWIIIITLSLVLIAVYEVTQDEVTECGTCPCGEDAER